MRAHDHVAEKVAATLLTAHDVSHTTSPQRDIVFGLKLVICARDLNHTVFALAMYGAFHIAHYNFGRQTREIWNSNS